MKLASLTATTLVLTLAPAARADVLLDGFDQPAFGFSIFFGAPLYESRAITIETMAATRSETLLQNSSGINATGTEHTVSGLVDFGYWSSLNVPATGSGSVTAADANALTSLLDISGPALLEVDFTVPMTNFGTLTVTLWDETLTVSDSYFTGTLPTNGSYTLFLDAEVEFTGTVDPSRVGAVQLLVASSNPMTLTRFEAVGGSLVPLGNDSFCDDADGSLASCPCANPGSPDTGCDIQQGTGGVRLDVVTQQTSPSNGVTATGTGFPGSSAPAAIVIRASTLEASPVPFGDGLRCVGTPLVRLAATFASAGSSTHTFGHGTMAGTGDFYYQLWFRNTPAMFCTPDAFNLSNGRTLTW